MKEQEIQNKIVKYLESRGIEAFRINSGTIKKGKYVIRLAPKGFSDIMGVFPSSGQALFIEVKTDNSNPSAIQQAFLDKMNRQGALAFMVRSVEGVEKILNEVV